MASTTLTSQLIKQMANEAGFDLVGVARAERLDSQGFFFNNWLHNGFHAGMDWLARNPAIRTDPRFLLDGCRSVVAVAINYHIKSDSSVYKTSVGKIAQYARWDDYHRTFGKSVRLFATRIAQAAGDGHFAKGCCDTSPIMEKAWAECAGIGFIGKNTCLINPRRGSYFLLGVVLTTLELEPDSAANEACGTCTRCMDACPTNALPAPGVLDSSRCISYLTIEHRGDLPEEMRNQLNGWLFGCDICQEVCPYNIKFSIPAGENDILGTARLAPAIDLDAILSVQNEDEFISLFGRRSALRRAKLDGIKRNAHLLAEMTT